MSPKAVMHLDMLSRYPDTAPKVPPLLFLHGSFTDARVWDPNFLPFFAHNGYAVHALSLWKTGSDPNGTALSAGG